MEKNSIVNIKMEKNSIVYPIGVRSLASAPRGESLMPYKNIDLLTLVYARFLRLRIVVARRHVLRVASLCTTLACRLRGRSEKSPR